MIKESDIISFSENRGLFLVIAAVTVANINSRSSLYTIPKPYTARLLKL